MVTTKLRSTYDRIPGDIRLLMRKLFIDKCECCIHTIYMVYVYIYNIYTYIM